MILNILILLILQDVNMLLINSCIGHPNSFLEIIMIIFWIMSASQWVANECDSENGDHLADFCLPWAIWSPPASFKSLGFLSSTYGKPLTCYVSCAIETCKGGNLNFDIAKWRRASFFEKRYHTNKMTPHMTSAWQTRACSGTSRIGGWLSHVALKENEAKKKKLIHVKMWCCGSQAKW